jgi:hypothetical protein
MQGCSWKAAHARTAGLTHDNHYHYHYQSKATAPPPSRKEPNKAHGVQNQL